MRHRGLVLAASMLASISKAFFDGYRLGSPV
jgi:hypothetical protein